MSTDTYTPREGSVAWKVIQFLRANPDEELDADLISAKCDCDRRSVHTLLGPAVQAGLLVRSEDLTSGELVYGVGTGAGDDMPPVQPTVSPFKAWLERKGEKSAEGRSKRRPPEIPAPSPAKRKQSAPFHLDLSVVQIEKDVPIPGLRTRAIDWASLLERLDVGDSFFLPVVTCRSSITAAMKAFKGATGKVLTSRVVDGGIRVWRVE